jgi:hypothetical protein
MTNKFDSIRPYNNDDLPDVLKGLVNNPEFINTLVKFRFSKWPRFSRPLVALFLKLLLSYKIKSLTSLSDFQRRIEPYMKRMIRKTTHTFTISGIDSLDMTKPCLFVSNHRDIALDPAFVNWALHLNGQDTVRIAVGDNLLSESWIADLIRLNKCFVVQRSVEGRREKLAAAKLLSEYIEHSLQTDKQHLWIAQREGRAKDGADVTNPAIVSMLTLNKHKTEAFGDYVAKLRIIPVSISYEFDPCDADKAKELCQAEKEGGYDKPDNEDIRSIVRGINGQKGRVHIHFGKLVSNQFSNTKEVAHFIDEQILDGYCAFPTADIALALYQARQENKQVDLQDMSANYDKQQQAAHTYLTNKLAALNTLEQEKLLLMYANPLLRKQDKEHVA